MLYLGFVLYCMAAWQLRRPCREVTINYVLALPESLLSASYCMLSGAPPLLLHAILLQYRQLMSQRGGVDSESTMLSPFRKGYSSFQGEPNHYHGRITLRRPLMYEDSLMPITNR